jgi:hypothetical protein
VLVTNNTVRYVEYLKEMSAHPSCLRSFARIRNFKKEQRPSQRGWLLFFYGRFTEMKASPEELQSFRFVDRHERYFVRVMVSIQLAHLINPWAIIITFLVLTLPVDLKVLYNRNKMIGSIFHHFVSDLTDSILHPEQGFQYISKLLTPAT